MFESYFIGKSMIDGFRWRFSFKPIWLVVSALPLWKMMEFVSWDDEIPNWKVIIHIESKPPVNKFYNQLAIQLVDPGNNKKINGFPI